MDVRPWIWAAVSVVGLALLPPAATGQAAPEDQKPDPGDAAGAEANSEKAPEADASPEALRDPIVAKLIKHRVLIDRPRFSLETGGKVQVQYYGADSGDPENADKLFLRRFRPFVLGRIGKSWRWKAEAELGADIEAGKIDLAQLDIRDVYVRYQGFEASGRRLTLGNQKAPFSRDFLTPSTHLLQVERSFVGDTTRGVPERPLGVHFRTEQREGRVAYSATVGALGHDPGADQLKFDSLVGGGGNLNEGVVLAGRLDLHPRGEMTFADSDRHTPRVKYTWSLAGYVWENDGGKNRFTEGGAALDPEKADLDSAAGLEVSGGLRGRGITLDWQVNRIRADTVAREFTGGLYAGGETTLDVSGVEGGYRFRRVPVELGGALARFDADGYAAAWETATLALNLYVSTWLTGKLQITHDWISNRNGVPGADFREIRIQTQYVW